MIENPMASLRSFDSESILRGDAGKALSRQAQAAVLNATRAGSADLVAAEMTVRRRSLCGALNRVEDSALHIAKRGAFTALQG